MSARRRRAAHPRRPAAVPARAEPHRLACRGRWPARPPRNRFGAAWSSPSELADDLLAVLDTMGLDRVLIVGHDLGGRLGFDLSLRASSRVRRLAPAAARVFPLADLQDQWAEMDSRGAVRQFATKTAEAANLLADQARQRRMGSARREAEVEAVGSVPRVGCTRPLNRRGCGEGNEHDVDGQDRHAADHVSTNYHGVTVTEDYRWQRCDPLAPVERLMHPQQRLLHQVLGLGDARSIR